MTRNHYWRIRDSPNGSYPVQRGFDKYYGCLHGGGSYHKPSPVYNNLEKVTDLPDYYYTQAITDSAVSYVQAHDTRKPMFFIRSPLRASSSITSSCRICKKMH